MFAGAHSGLGVCWKAQSFSMTTNGFQYRSVLSGKVGHESYVTNQIVLELISLAWFYENLKKSVRPHFRLRASTQNFTSLTDKVRDIHEQYCTSREIGRSLDEYFFRSP